MGIYKIMNMKQQQYLDSLPDYVDGNLDQYTKDAIDNAKLHDLELQSEINSIQSLFAMLDKDHIKKQQEYLSRNVSVQVIQALEHKKTQLFSTNQIIAFCTLSVIICSAILYSIYLPDTQNMSTVASLALNDSNNRSNNNASEVHDIVYGTHDIYQSPLFEEINTDQQELLDDIIVDEVFAIYERELTLENQSETPKALENEIQNVLLLEGKDDETL
jgi:hypothetical protein